LRHLGFAARERALAHDEGNWARSGPRLIDHAADQPLQRADGEGEMLRAPAGVGVVGSGLVVTSNSSLSAANRVLWSKASISGFPLTVESTRLDDHMASNLTGRPSCSALAACAIRPHKGLCTSSTRANPQAAICRRSWRRRFAGVVPSAPSSDR
jgi:hypothetical protein